MHIKILIFRYNLLNSTTVSKEILADWYGRKIASFFQNIVLSFEANVALL